MGMVISLPRYSMVMFSFLSMKLILALYFLSQSIPKRRMRFFDGTIWRLIGTYASLIAMGTFFISPRTPLLLPSIPTTLIGESLSFFSPKALASGSVITDVAAPESAITFHGLPLILASIRAAWLLFGVN